MIISASRRTDIPAYFSEWFINRIKAGYTVTRNPFNPAQIKRVSLLPGDVDCIVFWTKNPENLLSGLDTLDSLGYMYCFQFTLTPYGSDIERGLPGKRHIEDTFIALSKRLGKDRVLWRYDPIILNGTLDIAYHAEQFERMCERLAERTPHVTISFVDMYKKVKTSLIREITGPEILELARLLGDIARRYSLPVKTCCEAAELSGFGIERGACIDSAHIEKLIGRPLGLKSDSGQRPGCGCAASVDIGAYNTCLNGCVYCYANHSPASIKSNLIRHDPTADELIRRE